MENLFEQAKNAVTNLITNQGTGASSQDKQAAQNAIQAAYNDCSQEEKQHLQQLEQQLNEGQLS